MELKRKEDVFEDFRKGKEMFDFNIYLVKSKHYDNLHKLVIDKMKDESVGVAIKELFELNITMHLFTIDNSCDHANNNFIIEKKAQQVQRCLVK